MAAVPDKDALIEALSRENQVLTTARRTYTPDSVERELHRLRFCITAAIALCEEIEREHGMDVAHSHGHGMVDAAEAIRRKLEEA